MIEVFDQMNRRKVYLRIDKIVSLSESSDKNHWVHTQGGTAVLVNNEDAQRLLKEYPRHG